LRRSPPPFERGETSRNRRTGGADLGLSIVQALANRPEGGLAATISLPAPFSN
jgi:signal transduction histidine kinase